MARRTRHRRRDDRLRHGHRQGRRPLRLPLQPAQEPRELRAGDRPRRPRRRSRRSASCSPARTTCRRSRTSPTATRRRARRSRACSPRCSRTRRARTSPSSEYELSARHDMRPLVLKTRLTYLELDGVLRQGTPFYAGYRLRPLGEARSTTSSAASTRARAAFLRAWSAQGKTGRTWTTLAPDDAAAELGEDRAAHRRGARVPRRSRAWSSCSRPRCASATRCSPRPPIRRELRRRGCSSASRAGSAPRRRGSQHVLDARHARRLPGAARSSATSARRAPSRAGTAPTASTGRAQQLPRPEPQPPIDDERRRATRSPRCASDHPDALGEPRQQARFLAGITSPATTRAKLTRDPLFGSLADRRFADVLAWCRALT